MSISREIWRKASPSNRRLVASALRRFPVAAGAALFGAFFVTVPWTEAYAHLRERSDERAALAPFLAEARAKPVTFPEVVVSHPAYLHKLVYWDVTVQSSTSSYAAGRPAWPVVWTNPERLPKDAPLWQQTALLARVENVRDDVVFLEYVGKP